MAFWSAATFSPLRKYRFKVTGLLERPWLVKRASLPSFEIGVNSYQVLNHQTKVPGILSWKDITIETVAIKESVTELINLMSKHGQTTDPSDKKNTGVVNQFTGKLQKKILIEMLDMEGAKSNSFEMYNWFIVNMTYAELDYSVDELFTIEMTIAYEYAKIT